MSCRNGDCEFTKAIGNFDNLTSEIRPDALMNINQRITWNKIPISVAHMLHAQSLLFHSGLYPADIIRDDTDDVVDMFIKMLLLQL